MSDTNRNRLMFAIAIAMAAIYLFPLYWMYITALKSGSEMFATPPSFWPSSPQWSTYAYVWESRNMGRYLWNSLVIALGSVALHHHSRRRLRLRAGALSQHLGGYRPVPDPHAAGSCQPP